MKKKVLSLFLAVVLMLAALPAMGASAAGKVFRDVPKNEWYAGFVYGLVDAGIINGMTPTTFEPYTTISREQYIKMLIAAVASSGEISQAKSKGYFSDVPQTWWSAGYINLAVDYGIIAKGSKFDPRTAVTRGDAALWMYNLSKAFPEQASLEPIRKPITFPDMANASAAVKEAVDACYRANILSGDAAGTFRPNGLTKRSEATKMISKLLKIPPRSKDQIPEPPVFQAPKVYSTTAAGQSVRVVEFDPTKGYSAQIKLANDKLDTVQAASSMRPSNAVVAVDGMVFNSNSNNRVYSNMISNGQLIRIDNTYKRPTFVIDKNGKASIQYFTIQQSFTLTDENGESHTLEDVRCNWPYSDPNKKDGTRILYTDKYGSSIPGKTYFAVTMDKNFTITKITENGSDIAIPKGGYVLIQGTQRFATDKNDFFKYCANGVKLTQKLTYPGSSTQNIATCLSAGPTVLKNGVVDTSNMYQEGSWDSHITGSGARMSIGVKSDGTVVIASCSGTLQQEGNVMKALGCTSAMNLDGGASTYLYANGQQLASPGRSLNNMLVFTRS